MNVWLRAVAVMVLLAFSSCNSLLDNDDEFYRVSTQEQQWNTISDTRSALMGVYGLMRSALAENNTYWAVGEMRLGDFTVLQREDLKALVRNELDAPYDNIAQISNWNRFYKVVNAASVFMENAGQVVQKDKSYSQTIYEYDVAQMRALRALAYFYMARMWGDVPLITQSYDNGTFPKVPRTDAATVLAYAKSELKNAAEVLPVQLGSSSDKYYNGDNSAWSGVLLNRLSCYTILAHLSAWEGNYVDAASYSSYVLEQLAAISGSSSSPYLNIDELVGSSGVFYYNFNSRKRHLRLVSFVYKFGDGSQEYSTDGHLEDWTLAYPLVAKPLPDIFVTKQRLFELFTNPRDLRFGMKDTLTNSGYYSNYVNSMLVEYPLFSKVKVIGDTKGTDLRAFTSAIILNRAEDVMLLNAEALCMLNRGDEAIGQLNGVRSQRGLRNLSFSRDFDSSPQKLLKEVFDERHRELMGEGHLWFDRIRRARVLGDDPQMEELIKTNAIYWPVAQDVMTANPLIKQTEYWNK